MLLENLTTCHVEKTQTAGEGGWKQQGTLRGSRDDVLLRRTVEFPNAPNTFAATQTLLETLPASFLDAVNLCPPEQVPRLHVDSEETSHEIKAPEPEEHAQLPRVNAHFGPLHVVQLGTAATLSDVNHADSPKCGTNVGDGASHVRGADNGTKVGSAHGILQAACCRHQANREQPAWNEGCCHQQAGVQYQSQAIEGLAHEVHLILVDQETAGICTTQEGEDQEACLLQAFLVGCSMPTVQ